MWSLVLHNVWDKSALGYVDKCRVGVCRDMWPHGVSALLPAPAQSVCFGMPSFCSVDCSCCVAPQLSPQTTDDLFWSTHLLCHCVVRVAANLIQTHLPCLSLLWWQTGPSGFMWLLFLLQESFWVSCYTIFVLFSNMMVFSFPDCLNNPGLEGCRIECVASQAQLWTSIVPVMQLLPHCSKTYHFCST